MNDRVLRHDPHRLFLRGMIERYLLISRSLYDQIFHNAVFLRGFSGQYTHMCRNCDGRINRPKLLHMDVRTVIFPGVFKNLRRHPIQGYQYHLIFHRLISIHFVQGRLSCCLSFVQRFLSRYILNFYLVACDLQCVIDLSTGRILRQDGRMCRLLEWNESLRVLFCIIEGMSFQAERLFSVPGISFTISEGSKCGGEVIGGGLKPF